MGIRSQQSIPDCHLLLYKSPETEICWALLQHKMISQINVNLLIVCTIKHLIAIILYVQLNYEFFIRSK